MRLYEFLFEDVSSEASLKNIIDILTTELPGLYRELGKMAEKYYDSHGELGRGFAFVSGSPKSKWFQTSYEKLMKPALYNFSKGLPKNSASQLLRFLSDNTGQGKFSMIENSLVDILGNIAISTKNERLQRAISTTRKALENYGKLLDKLEASSAEDSEYDEPVGEPRPNIVAQQNASVEAIVRDVLSRVDPRQAGEIRNIISRSDNKLQALQRELTRRGINL